MNAAAISLHEVSEGISFLLNLTSGSSAESGGFREKRKLAFVFPSCRWTSTDAGNARNIVESDVSWLDYSALSVDVVCIIVAPRKRFFRSFTQHKFFFWVFLAKTASHPPLVWLLLRSAQSKLEHGYKCRALLRTLKANLCTAKWRKEKLNGNTNWRAVWLIQ